ncbi:PLP-dependent aminotransferase family protein [Christensenella minuta]|uniref:MocR-like pyridoxine biosynthesis transcription factor PdxR n=1 Tax=Christensenella minuta TaxID=626937 RepID=UPI002A7F7420|nr:PLP-dependent aminotransferase family protein [Christensenella minuta]MDY3751489.1 PLP-dependent aminotransferase family protein [Christensenella minuta]
MLTPILKVNKKTPIYEQLYHYLRTEIEAGRLSEGFHLPSKRKFAAHLKISQGTVEAAYSQLLAEGYIYSLEKRGYYVCRMEEGTLLHHSAKKAAPSIVIPIQDDHRFVLSTGRVDTDHFPFAAWAKLMREVLSMESDSLLRPLDPQGDASLRTGIVRYLHDFRGIEAAPEQIILGAGSEYLLSLITQLLPRENLYAIEDPGYRKTEHILHANGIRTVPVPLNQTGMDVDALEASGADVAHVTPSHHFPLGIVTPVGQRQRLLSWAARADRYIIEDDYDSEFRFSGKPIPALQSLDAQERVIYLNTFAKTLAPSLRISYMVLPAHLLKKYRETLLFYSCTIPSFEQRTLALFLARGHFERHLHRMRKIYKSRRDAFMEGLRNSWDKINFSGADSGPHLLLTVKNGMSEGELIRTAAEKSVQLTPLSSYYTNGCTFSPTVVAGYSGYHSEELRKAARLLRAAWFDT